MYRLSFILLILLCTNLSAELVWVQKHHNRFEYVKTFQVLDSNHCYAFIDSNYQHVFRFYKSNDQGNTWDLIYRDDPFARGDSISNIYHCQAVDTNIIYISYGQKISIEKSNDGGKTFQRKTFGKYSSEEYEWEFVFDLNMFDKDIGILVSSSFVFYTFDGWETYRIDDKKTFPEAGGNAFYLDSENVVMLRDYLDSHEFVKFNLNNETWSQYSYGEVLEPNEPPKAMFDIHFINDSLGFACGGQNNKNPGTNFTDIIWKTTNRGKNWDIIHEDQGKNNYTTLSSLSFSNDGQHGIALGGFAKVLESIDGGKSWKYGDLLENIKLKNDILIIFVGQFPVAFDELNGIMRREIVNYVVEYEDEQIKIYQSFDELVIEQINKPASNLHFQIIDLLGREFLKKSYENQQNISIDLSQINSGFYMYRIISDGRVLRTGKIVR
jgi:type IX secretion system substrate protein